MNTQRHSKLLVLITASCAIFTMIASSPLHAGNSLTALIGHPVQTEAGDSVGTVEDFSINPTTGKLDFVVVSIGSFLIENSLIAVQPEALAPAADGKPLVLSMADLEVANRFNADNWPLSADVRGAVANSSGEQANANSPATTGTGPSNRAGTGALTGTGSATITAGKRSATFANGKREIVNGPIRRERAAPTQPAPRPPRVVANFKNLDRNRDGRLSRAEIGAQLNQQSGFKNLDIDSNGTIDDFEYQAYVERIARERRWAGNRGGANSLSAKKAAPATGS